MKNVKLSFTLYFNGAQNAVKFKLYRGIKMDKLANFLERAVLIGLTALMVYPILGVAYFMIKAA